MKRFLLFLCFLVSLCWASDVRAQCTGTFSANDVCGTTTGGFPAHTPSTSFPANPVFSTGITAPSLTAPAATNLGLNAPTGQDVQFQINGTPITVQQATAFLPVTDNATALGGSGNRWSSLYTVLGNYTGTQTYAAGSFLNNQTTLLPTVNDANNAYAAFFNPCVNATTFPCTGGSALPSTGVVFNLNRVKVGEASLASSDYLLTGLPSTPSWLDTLFGQALVGTSQLASGSAFGITGVMGYARTSDFFNYSKGTASSGSQGGLFIAYNNDTSGTNPIADAILAVGVQHSGGTGLTTLGQQTDINAATTVDVTPNGNANGETLGLLLTSGAYTGLAAAKPSAAIDIAYGGFHTFRRGINVLATALDPTVGCGGSCAIFADLPGGGNSGHAATIRWLDSTPGVDSEIWGDGNGFNVNSISRFVGQITGISNALGGTAPTNSGDGLLLENTTAAANNAQQNSPNIHLLGQGWKTTSTAASQTVDWLITNLPVQGTANPTTNLAFSSQVNGAGYVTEALFGSTGLASWSLSQNTTTQFQVANANAGTSALASLSAIVAAGSINLNAINTATPAAQLLSTINGTFFIDAQGTSGIIQMRTGATPTLGFTLDASQNATVVGVVRANTGFNVNGTAGITQTCTVNQAKTLVFTLGILTGGSCNS
jgi:hypothetical protein